MEGVGIPGPLTGGLAGGQVESACADGAGARAVRRFAHPPLVHSLALFSVLFFAALAAFGVALPWLDPGSDHRLLAVSTFALSAVSLLVSWAGLRSARDVFLADGEGLRWQSPGKPDVFLRWDEVAEVAPQNVMQRLVVADAGGAKRILVEFHLQGYGELRRLVLERSAARKGR